MSTRIRLGKIVVVAASAVAAVFTTGTAFAASAPARSGALTDDPSGSQIQQKGTARSVLSGVNSSTLQQYYYKYYAPVR